jgi:hypothetical protein
MSKSDKTSSKRTSKRGPPKKRKAVPRVRLPARVLSVDPIIILLQQLRADPTEEKVKRIVTFVKEERIEYYHLRKAAEKAIGRPLTEGEQKEMDKLQ